MGLEKDLYRVYTGLFGILWDSIITNESRRSQPQSHSAKPQHHRSFCGAGSSVSVTKLHPVVLHEAIYDLPFCQGPAYKDQNQEPLHAAKAGL